MGQTPDYVREARELAEAGNVAEAFDVLRQTRDLREVYRLARRTGQFHEAADAMEAILYGGRIPEHVHKLRNSGDSTVAESDIVGAVQGDFAYYMRKLEQATGNPEFAQRADASSVYYSHVYSSRWDFLVKKWKEISAYRSIFETPDLDNTFERVFMAAIASLTLFAPFMELCFFSSNLGELRFLEHSPTEGGYRYNEKRSSEYHSTLDDLIP